MHENCTAMQFVPMTQILIYRILVYRANLRVHPKVEKKNPNIHFSSRNVNTKWLSATVMAKKKDSEINFTYSRIVDDHTSLYECLTVYMAYICMHEMYAAWCEWQPGFLIDASSMADDGEHDTYPEETWRLNTRADWRGTLSTIF